MGVVITNNQLSHGISDIDILSDVTSSRIPPNGYYGRVSCTVEKSDHERPSPSRSVPMMLLRSSYLYVYSLMSDQGKRSLVGSPSIFSRMEQMPTDVGR